MGPMGRVPPQKKLGAVGPIPRGPPQLSLLDVTFFDVIVSAL